MFLSEAKWFMIVIPVGFDYNHFLSLAILLFISS